MTIHACVDLETLDVLPSAVVLSLGAVKFDPYKSDEPHSEIYFKINIDDQNRFNRTTSDGTLAWWSKQDPHILEEALDQEGSISVEQALDSLRKFSVGVGVFWGQGYGFDFTILEHMYRSVSQNIPWNFWQIRDSRTLFSMCPSDPRSGIQTEKHNALADAYYQAKAIQIAYSELKTQ